ncbi:hypothetical protein KIN20_013338 [Parelaphostrongylus tenuis]|uniref:Secreted protein n=1 Tax=Parelaphostrongylus tenuis TaxID=148309 RepID=A0AAD5QNQ2_PARTN|nr:hypothetical protein KIN20_013338 [Parelaphostrongylus tenuis]
MLLIRKKIIYMLVLQTYDCDLEGEAFETAKANCELPKPPEPTKSSLGSNNCTLTKFRYNSTTGRAFPDYDEILRNWFTTVGSYNDTYSLRPLHYKNSTMIPFLQVCYNNVILGFLRANTSTFC